MFHTNCGILLVLKGLLYSHKSGQQIRELDIDCIIPSNNQIFFGISFNNKLLEFAFCSVLCFRKTSYFFLKGCKRQFFLISLL